MGKPRRSKKHKPLFYHSVNQMLRARIVSLRLQGYSMHEIARIVQRSWLTVHNLFYKEAAKRDGGPKFDPLRGSCQQPNPEKLRQAKLEAARQRRWKKAAKKKSDNDPWLEGLL